MPPLSTNPVICLRKLFLEALCGCSFFVFWKVLKKEFCGYRPEFTNEQIEYLKSGYNSTIVDIDPEINEYASLAKELL